MEEVITTHDIYLANPLGFTESGRHMIQQIILPAFEKDDIKVYEPFRELPPKAVERFGAFDLSNPEACLFGAETNIRAIRTAKLVLAILDGVDVDSGTSSEIGYAYAKGKKIIGIRTDFRGTSAESSAVRINLQVEGFIRLSGGQIYDSYESGIQAAIQELHKNF